MTRVSLAPRHVREGLADARIDSAPPLLSAQGPAIVLGEARQGAAPATPIAPAPDTLFGPRGACLAAPDGPLFVCDTGHHRLLIWIRAPARDNAPADIVIGQKDFASEGRNARAQAGPATLNVPTSVAFGDGVLAVADAWNHRVLLWREPPGRNNAPADVVLGQADFHSVEANRGLPIPRADTLNWCYGLAIHEGRLFVADTGNRRVLVWNAIPQTNGAPADLVLGQRDFTTRDENGGIGVGPAGMRWPHGISFSRGMFFVADAGNNRVMAWNDMPQRNGAPCAFVLGQGAFEASDHNRAAYDPTPSSLNMPYGLAATREQLVVADTANSRLLGFDIAALAMDSRARNVSGQSRFDKKGDNSWRPPARDTLCWPYSVSACDNRLAVADSGNNRVLLWDLA